MSNAYDIARDVHMRPTSIAVARLVASHGSEAAEARWYWINPRTLGDWALRGRVELGWDPLPQTGARRRAFPEDVENAAVEAAFALGSGAAGEAAAGMAPSSLQRAFFARALTWPRSSTATRSRNTRDGYLANRGDAEARARVDARLAHGRAVYEVCRAALALVPDQPPSGRPRLPEPGPALAAALATFPPAAVAAVFPSLERAA